MAQYIAIAGNMGSGKTSLVDFLERRYDIKTAYEPNDDNPYLSDFYEDMTRWALHSQLFFLARKVKLHQMLQKSKRTGLLDRTIYEDGEVFARNLYLYGKMSDHDYDLYISLYRQLVVPLQSPRLLIFLRCRLPALRERIMLRGRGMEQQVPDHYLTRLNRLYALWITRYKKMKLSPVVEIRSDKIDYVSDLTHQIHLLKTVESVIDEA